MVTAGRTPPPRAALSLSPPRQAPGTASPAPSLRNAKGPLPSPHSPPYMPRPASRERRRVPGAARAPRIGWAGMENDAVTLENALSAAANATHAPTPWSAIALRGNTKQQSVKERSYLYTNSFLAVTLSCSAFFLEFRQPPYPCVGRILRRGPLSRPPTPRRRGAPRSRSREARAGSCSALRSPVLPGGTRVGGRGGDRHSARAAQESAFCAYPFSPPLQGTARGVWRGPAGGDAGGGARCLGNSHPAGTRALGAEPSASQLLRNRRVHSGGRAAELRGCRDAARVGTRGTAGAEERLEGSRVGSAPPAFLVSISPSSPARADSLTRGARVSLERGPRP
ncbi:uncharacterized protein LOC130829802 [Hippopotamus amphibius kiboko]|uniref:uncharacterized protein LOC130829802 n=1 Tax=Hippopotamus amphibius kiboko TaxID=575201 RepID=UPI002599A8B5|nr:uncharacterized protein LOC130829802 [Hippopotamus amphibius kiboko]